MRSPKLVRRLLLYAPTLGLLTANGCLATLERNVDLLLGSDALQNAMLLPYSPVAELAELFVRLLRG